MKLTEIKKHRKQIGRIVNNVVVIAFVLCILSIFLWIYRQDKLRAQAQTTGAEESPIQANKGYDYGESGFKEVARNEKYTLYTDFTTGEILVEDNATGFRWYSNPQDREEDKIIAIKTNLSAQLYVTSLDLEYDTKKDENNFAGSIKTGNMTYELVENGIKYSFAFPATGIIIPVQYTLNEKGLLAEVLTDEIQELWSRYVVANISLLPWFGAGGMEEDGYLFVPDGSGSVINFNNDKQRFRQYAAPVYGPNATTTKQTATVNEQVLMPVFGINKQQNGFLGVITEGETYATINACVSKKGSSYNYVYSSVILRDYATATMLVQQGAGANSHEVDMTEGLVLDHGYSVQYIFMEEGAAEYSDMAVSYREYLKETGGLKDSELADKQYVILNLYGAVSIEQYVMGIKADVVTALTTYNDVVDIVKELKGNGVENLIVNYIGALDSGLHNDLFTTVKTESVLGSKKDFNNMVNYLKQENVQLFLETNPIELYSSGNGYRVNSDSVKGFFQENLYMYNLDLGSGERDETTRWRLIQPRLVPSFMEKFAQSAVKSNTNNISIAQIGAMLYSDYADENDRFTSREQALQYWEQSLAASSSLADYVLVHEGNIYCAPYADVIIEVPSGDSQYDMTDYSVPFYQIVMRGESVLGTDAINGGNNYAHDFLKAQELGSSLTYSLIAGDIKNLISTEYNNMMSYSYDFWKETIIEQANKMQQSAALTAGQKIVGHSYVAEDVTLTQYENGAIMLVNYSNQDFTYNGLSVEAGSYLVQGGAQ